MNFANAGAGLSGWGCCLVILGTLAIGSSVLITMATMVFLGWLMFLAGVMQTAHGFSCKGWGGFFIDLIVGPVVHGGRVHDHHQSRCDGGWH